jgi:hypothetical protein
MKDENESDYLWDRSGEVDPGVARLESLLGTLRSRRSDPVLPRHGREARRTSRHMRAVLATAALLVLIAGAVWFVFGMRRSTWDVENIAGLPVVDGRTVEGAARLGIGDWLVTDASSRARVAVGQIGRVDVEPNTRVQLVESKGREHRMALERGTIHARIWAPPKFFFVDTPSAVAIDLGCAYTLRVDDSGAGELKVTQGWVGFEHNGREAFIPQGAMCATRPGIGPGTPRYEDAPEGYAAALALLDFGSAADGRRAEALDFVLANARRRDAMTLWHLLSRGTIEERARVYDRLAALQLPPEGVTRERVLQGDRAALEGWWDRLGVERGSWWMFLKKKF